MSSTAKLNNELARPIGIVDGTRPGGGNKAPRAYCKALTDTLVTRIDGTTYSIPKNGGTRTRKAPQNKPAPRVERVIVTVLPDGRRRRSVIYV